MEKWKNGKLTKKIFILFSFYIIVILAAFVGASFTRKVKAGVIVDKNYQITTTTTITEATSNSMFLKIYYGETNYQVINCNVSVVYQNNTLSGILRVEPVENWNAQIAGTYRVKLYVGTPGRTFGTGLVYINENYDFYLDIASAYNYLDTTNFTSLQFTRRTTGTPSDYHYFYLGQNIISSVNNIYDLQQNDVALIYISDVSGLASTLSNEITINWGYIDSQDNTIYEVYAPKVQAQLMEADDLIVRLSVPTNNAGTTSSTYGISQRALLTTISAGGATATAHIYGIYVWLQAGNRIQWGIAEFDTSGLPASGASMNYITSLTSLYDYTAVNTSTMTCRLSISDNFNFITIRNQPVLSANNINTVIQQGGFLPAWSLYNWARGSSAGYTSGEQAGAAPYQPGNPGYQAIYEAGKQAGIAENIGTVNWFVSAFSAVDAFLNIRIFPNITFGYLLGIPFIISLVWFIIRTFRGGGGGS